MRRAQLIQKILDDHFPHPEIPLHHTSPYTLLIAVLLSARCTDAMVNRITPHLFKRADTPETMVQLTIPEIQAIIRPCGLSPRKASAIWHLSKILLDKHQGEVPQNISLLEELPGVGHKTASVVMAQAFQVPTFPVDTHIHRCAKRWGLSSGKNREVTERDLKKLFTKESWIKLHLQIIYFARKYCFARGHKKNNCPICYLVDNN